MKTAYITCIILMLACWPCLLFAETNRPNLNTEYVYIDSVGWIECVSNMIDIAVWGTVAVSENIVIGSVKICCSNGVVTIEEGVTLDEASQEFWKVLAECYPACFPAYQPLSGQTNVIKKLAADGHICAVLGHNWRDGRPGEGEGSEYGGWFADYHPGVFYRTCRICRKCEIRLLSEWR